MHTYRKSTYRRLIPNWLLITDNMQTHIVTYISTLYLQWVHREHGLVKLALLSAQTLTWRVVGPFLGVSVQPVENQERQHTPDQLHGVCPPAETADLRDKSNFTLSGESRSQGRDRLADESGGFCVLGE